MEVARTPNWRAHVLEPVLTAVIVFGITLVTLIVGMVASAGLGYLPIALFVGTFFPLILAFPWVAFTAIFSWSLRRRSHWWSLAMGGCASALLACVALWPLFAGAINMGDGLSVRDVPGVAFMIAVIIAVAIVQFFVHVGIRARHGREVAQELG